MKKVLFSVLFIVFCLSLDAQGVLPLKTTLYYKEMKKKKIEVVSDDYADMDGDDLKEVILVVKSKKGKQAFLVLKATDDRKNYQEVIEFKIREALALEKYEIDDINGDKRQDLLIWTKDDSPDETGRHLTIIAAYGGTFKKIFEGSYYFNKADEATGSQENVIQWGEIKDGIRLVDEDKNGSKEILIPREKRLVYFGHTTPPTTVIYGVLYDIYRYKKGAYVKDENPKVENFLTPIKINNIEASSELVKRPKRAKRGGETEPEVLNPAKWAADGNIGSAWSPNTSNKKRRQKESIRFEFDGSQTLKAMVMIPGCMETEDSWEPNNKITSFSIRISNGTESQVRRGKFQDVSSPILGVVESPRAESNGAFQYMIFFEEGTSTYSVEIIIDGVEKGKKGRRTCISEVMFF